MLDCNLSDWLCFVQVEKLNQPNTLPNGILITTKSKVRGMKTCTPKNLTKLKNIKLDLISTPASFFFG